MDSDLPCSLKRRREIQRTINSGQQPQASQMTHK